MKINSLKMLLEQGNATIHHMEAAAKRDEEAARRDELHFGRESKKDKFYARLQVAQAMGDTEELQRLKQEANEMF